MDEIALIGLEFFSKHGYYDEEQKIGNRYGVDIKVFTDTSEAGEKDSLKETINYETIYTIVKTVMDKPARLLEHIGHQIIQDLLGQFIAVNKVEVRISKFNPPIGGICERAAVKLIRQR